MYKLKHLANQILTEGRTKKIKLKKATQIFRNNCRMFNDSNTQIYRGIKGFDSNFGIVKPKQSKRKRKSQNTYNFYTLLIDNSKSWSQYPKRSESIICTTDSESAHGYGEGHFYLVIPFDLASIGVAPEADIWKSFNYHLKSQFNRYILLLADVADRLSNINSNVPDIESGGRVPKNSYSKFSNYITKVDKILSTEHPRSGKNKTGYEIIIKGLFSTAKFGHKGREFVKDYLDFNGNLLEYLKFILNPDRNGFNLKEYNSNFKVSGKGEREIWTDSPSILIHENTISRFVKSVNEHVGRSLNADQLV